MSKFFQALGTTEASVAGIEMPFTEQEMEAAPAVAPPQRTARHTVPVSTAVEPAAVRRDHSARISDLIRTVSIRVPADVPVLPFDGLNQHAAERYRMIRTRLVQHPAKPHVLCVASAN